MDNGCPRHRQALRHAWRHADRDTLGLPSHERVRHEPTTITTIAIIGITAAAAGATAYSQYQQGQAASQAALYNARNVQRNADFNNQIAEYNASMARAQGEQSLAMAELEVGSIEQQARFEREKVARAAARARGTTRARLGSAGVTTEGSPLLVLMETSRQETQDLERIRYGAELDKFSVRSGAAFENQASEGRARNFILEGLYGGQQADQFAGLQRFQAAGYRRAGAYGAGASLLSGAASAYGSYYRSTAGAQGV